MYLQLLVKMIYINAYTWCSVHASVRIHTYISIYSIYSTYTIFQMNSIDLIISFFAIYILYEYVEWKFKTIYTQTTFFHT